MSAVSKRGTIAALGEAERVEGFRLAGVRVIAAETAEAARTAWQAIPPDVAIVILTPAAADALGPLLREKHALPSAVMPR